jgi:tetratricopeptide (TPR) repeat protein
MTTSETSGQPYPGLRSFRRDETHIFFGRDSTINDMVDRLALHRFLAVTGTSGSGKSSLVRTGLLDALDRGVLTRAGINWRVADFRPGARPLAAMAVALSEATGTACSDKERRLIETRLARGPRGLVDWLDEIHLPAQTNLLLLVDQFEEIFRFRQGETSDDIDAFVALLLASAKQREKPIYVVITMRSDFLGECAQFTDLAETINDGQFLTPRLTREQCEQAIEGPAAVFGGSVEKALTTRLLNDMGTNADQLPLMQHVLMLLWQTAEGAGAGRPKLTLAQYEKLGGIGASAGSRVEAGGQEERSHGALNDHADKIYSELTGAQQRLARILFRALTVSEGASGRDVRRPTELREVADIAAVAPSELIPVVEAFRAPGRNFLTPFPPAPLAPDTTIDISHESLIRQWLKLREWTRLEFESAETYRHLEKKAVLWKQGDEEPMRMPYLGVVLAWRDGEHPNATWAARYGGAFDTAMEFLDRSQDEEQKRSDRRRQREEEELRHKLRTEAAERRVRRTSSALAASIVLLVTIVALASLWQRQSQIAGSNFRLLLDGIVQTVRSVQQGYVSSSINLDLALKLLNDTNALVRKLPTESEEPEARHAQLLVFDGLSETYTMTGDVTLALDAAEQELGIAGSLVRADPNHDEWQYDLAKSYLRIGAARTEMGDLIDVTDKSKTRTPELNASTALRKFLEIMQNLASKNPAYEEWQKDLSKGYDRMGDVLQSIGDLDGALTNYRRRLDVVTRNNLADTYWQWDEAISRLNIGDILLAKGELDAATAEFRALQSITAKLVEADKSIGRWRWTQALGRERVGDVEMRRGRAKTALEEFDAFLTLSKQLVEQDPANSNWQRGLAIAHERMGDAYLAQASALDKTGDDDEARAMRDNALGVYEEDNRIAKSLVDKFAKSLVDKNASNTTFRRDLSISEGKIGDALFALKNFDAALERYRGYSKLASALVREDPANADWQRDLAISYQRIGDTLRVTGATADAKETFRKCLSALAKYGKPVKSYDPRNSRPENIGQYCSETLAGLE